MAAIGRLVRLAPKLKELSVLHRNFSKATIALKPLQLPPSPFKSKNIWNLVRYSTSESAVEGDQVSAAELEELNPDASLSDVQRRQQSGQRRQRSWVNKEHRKESDILPVARDVSEWLNIYFSISKNKVEEFIRIAEIEKYNIPKQDVILLLRCLGDLMPDATKDEKREVVDRVWSKLKDSNVHLDCQIYNALIMVYVENDHPHSPAEILAEMQNNDIQPNMVTFKRLITAYCNKGDVASAKQLLEFMQADNMPIGPEVFNSFIKGHMKKGDLKGAEEVLQVMRDIDLMVTDEAYAGIICGLADMKELGPIPKFLDELKEVQCRLTSVVDIMISMRQNGFEQFDSELMKMVESSMFLLSDFTASVNKCHALGYLDIAKQICPFWNKNLAEKQSGSGYLENYIHSLALADIEKKTIENLIHSDKAIIAEYLSIAYLFYQLNFHDFGFEVLRKAKKMGRHVSAHCFFPAVIHYRETENSKKMIELLNILKTYDYIENQSAENYIALEMMPEFVKMNGEADVLKFLKNHVSSEQVQQIYFMYLLFWKTADEAVKFAKDNDFKLRYNRLEKALWSIKDYQTWCLLLDVCDGNGVARYKVHERGLKLLLTHGEKENAWDEVEEALKDRELFANEKVIPESMYQNAPESVQQKLQKYFQLFRKEEEQKQRMSSTSFRLNFIDAVRDGNIDRATNNLNKLFNTECKDIDYVMIGFLRMCVEKGDMKTAVDYFQKYINSLSDSQKESMRELKIARFTCFDILNKMHLLSPNKAEQLKHLLIQVSLIPEDFQLISLEKVQDLLKTDLNQCTDYVIDLYRKSNATNGITFLFQKLIVSEDHQRLQEVIDRMVPKLGERVVLSHLALTLINTHQIQKAVRVCSVPEVNVPSMLFPLLKKHGQIKEIEHFVEATKHVSYRSDLLFTLIQIYLSNRKYDKAVGVLDLFEEEFLKMSESQTKYLLQGLIRANYPIPPALQHDAKILLNLKDDKSTQEKNSPSDTEQLKVDKKRQTDVIEDPNDSEQWYKRVNDLSRLYQKDSELFDKVTSEVETDERKLTFRFINFLFLNKTEQAKELLTNHPDLMQGSKYDYTFLSLCDFLPKKLVEDVNKTLHDEFSHRRDLLLKYYTALISVNCVKTNRLAPIYEKFLEDGFQISDIHPKKVENFEKKLKSKEMPILWKPEILNETISTETNNMVDSEAKSEEMKSESNEASRDVEDMK